MARSKDTLSLAHKMLVADQLAEATRRYGAGHAYSLGWFMLARPLARLPTWTAVYPLSSEPFLIKVCGTDA